MYTQADKINKQASQASAANGGNNAVSVQPLQLKDNRASSINKKKQADFLNGTYAAGAITQKKANSTGLPDKLKSGVENISGIAMDDVNVHYNSAKPAQLNAHAYAQGTDIHIAPGQEKHLPHEAWHVVQQKQGRVKPTLQMKTGVPVNDDKGLDDEADAMGRKALQLKARYNALRSTSLAPARVSQRVGEEGGGGEHEQAGSFIVNDSQPASAKQVHKTDFLNELSASVTKMADDVLAKVHQTSAACPYIAYWFAHYENQSPAYIEKALARYAPGSLTTGNWQDCIHAVSARVRVAFLNHVANGSLAGVPEGIPRDLGDEGEPPPEKPATVQLMQDVAQLCCCSCCDSSSGQGNSAGKGGAGIDAKTATGTGGGSVAASSVSVVPGGSGGTGAGDQNPLTPEHKRDLGQLVRREGSTVELATAISHRSMGDEKKRTVTERTFRRSDLPTAARTRHVEDDGPGGEEAIGPALLAWIDETRQLIQGGQYRTAFARLRSETEAAKFGIKINEVESRERNMETMAGENSSDGKRKTIKLVVPVRPAELDAWQLELRRMDDPDYKQEDPDSWLDDAAKAARVLPMYLEEYMHQYQAITNSFFSVRTGQFKLESGLADFAERNTEDKGDAERADFDEVDVMAQLHAWGFNVVEIHYVERYGEREEFWEWMKQKGHR